MNNTQGDFCGNVESESVLKKKKTIVWLYNKMYRKRERKNNKRCNSKQK